MNISVSGKKMRRKMVERRVVPPLPECGSAAAEGGCMDVCPLVLQASDSTEAGL